MAGRLLNRRALRDDVSDSSAPDDADDEEEGSEEKVVKVKKPRAKKAPGDKALAKPRVRKKVTKASPILFAHWAVCDGGLKRLALFDYKDRAGAEAKLASIQEQKKGPFVLQLVKEPHVDVVVASTLTEQN